MDEPDIAAVARVASGLQHRLYLLTSSWTGAPVEVHRLQETVSRACTILESSLHSASETPLYSSSSLIRNPRPVHEQLFRLLATANGILNDIIEILEFIQPNSHQNLTEITRRWKSRREEVAYLRPRLGDCFHYILAQISLLNVAVSASSEIQGQPMISENDYGEDASTAQAQASASGFEAFDDEGTNPTSIRDHPDISASEETLIEREFDLKFRNVDFTNSFRRIDVAHRGPAHKEPDDRVSAGYEDEKIMRHVIEEQKSLSSTYVEPKSPDNLRGALIHTNVSDEQQTPRHSRNEKEFQHLERVFQMISPFDSQEADWVAPDQSSELINSASPRTQQYSKGLSRLGEGRPRSAHLGPSLRSLRLQGGCPPSCICVCHSQAYTGKGALSAFKTAFGSFTFIFSTRSSTVPCNIPTCVSRTGQYLQILYTFPSWLFHAAISATVRDWTMGSPELLLRVHRRIDANVMSTYASIFGFITRGEVENVKRVLSRREASVYDVAGLTGVSTLYHALRLRQMDIVELLLCEGADVFQLDDVGLGPYQEAIRVMYTSASAPFQERLQGILPMDQIMEAGELTNLHKIAMGILWTSAADYIEANGSGDVNAGDSNNQTPLYYASARGNTSVVQALLEAGANPDGIPQASPPSSAAGLESAAPLSMAARNGYLDVVERLIKAGAQVDMRSKHNRTALHECSPAKGDYSMQHTFVEIAACLLAHGADLNVVDNYGSTVLDSTCIRDHKRVAAFFIERGIDTTHRDWEGSNALHNCICFNSFECAALLLGLGPVRSGLWNIDDNGMSTLHYMATGGTAEMMDLFAETGLGGLDSELKNNQGLTALDVFNGRSSITDELREAFMRFLHAMTRPETAGLETQDSDSDSDSPEFFDADEFRS